MHGFQAATTRHHDCALNPALEKYLLCDLRQPTPHVYGIRDNGILSLG
jgi:hypothetical protein